MCEKRGCDHFPPLFRCVDFFFPNTHAKKKRAAAAVFKRALEHHTRPLSLSSSFVCVCKKTKERKDTCRGESSFSLVIRPKGERRERHLFRKDIAHFIQKNVVL